MFIIIAILVAAPIVWYIFMDKITVTCFPHYELSIETCFYQKKLWHGMFLTESNTDIFVEVMNNSNNVRELELHARVMPAPSSIMTADIPDLDLDNDSVVGEERITIPLTIKPSSKNGWLFSDHLADGQWKLSVGIYDISSTKSVQERLMFIVHPIQDLFNFIIAIGTIAGSLITAIALITQLFSNRSHTKALKEEIALQRKSRWTESYGHHSNQIADEIVSHWNKYTIFAEYKIESDRIIDRPSKEPSYQYSKEAQMHLMRGYPEIWILYQAAKKESVELTNEIRKAVENYKNVVVDAISQELEIPREHRWDSNLKKFYHDEAIFAGLLTVVLDRIKENRPKLAELHNEDVDVIDEHGRAARFNATQLILRGIRIARGNDHEMHRLKDVVDNLINNQSIYEFARKYDELYNKLEANEKAEQYQQYINKIRSDTWAGLTIKGEGSCEICKRLHIEVFGGV